MRSDWFAPLLLLAMSFAQAQSSPDSDVTTASNGAIATASRVAVSAIASGLGQDPVLSAAAANAASALVANAALPVYATSDFSLAVPFRTQKDGARFQGANCGPASLAMVLESYKMVQTNSDLRWLTQGYQGNQGRGGGTNLEDLASVGKDFGLNPTGLYNGDDFARWSPADVETQVRQGHPVIALVKYRLLPDHLTATIGYDHYVVIFGVRGDEFLYHDPAYQDAEDGAYHWISTSQLERAMAIASVPQQAVAFAPGKHSAVAFKAL